MTVQELKKLLEDAPDDALVLSTSGDSANLAPVSKASFRKVLTRKPYENVKDSPLKDFLQYFNYTSAKNTKAVRAFVIR